MPVEVAVRRHGAEVQPVAFAPFPDESRPEQMLVVDISSIDGADTWVLGTDGASVLHLCAWCSWSCRAQTRGMKSRGLPGLLT
jgi:hypothetical protein